MQTLDFAPLYRATVGFDRIADLMDRVLSADVAQPTYPPYNIERTAENAYRITMAVAGFSEDELSITQEQNMLLEAGSKATDENAQYLHRGIAGRSFQRRFQLADHVRVEGATLVNGLLTIDLRREIPEEMKPRRIAISSQEKTMQIEAPSQTNEQIAA